MNIHSVSVIFRFAGFDLYVENIPNTKYHSESDSIISAIDYYDLKARHYVMIPFRRVQWTITGIRDEAFQRIFESMNALDRSKSTIDDMIHAFDQATSVPIPLWKRIKGWIQKERQEEGDLIEM